jgi:hypothetical protein
VSSEISIYTFFRNEHSSLCGPINSCAAKVAGCGSDYEGTNLSMDYKTGVGWAVQNNDLGYSDTVCI